MEGWECPRCHRTYAPWVATCTACAAAPAPLPSAPRDPWMPSTTPIITCDYQVGDTVRIMGVEGIPEDQMVVLGVTTNLG